MIAPHHYGFVQAVAAALRERCGVRPGERVIVAVSGGADSVALLRAMHALAGRRPWDLDLHVAHINHRLRGDADADEAFVAQLAGSLGLRFHRRELHLNRDSGNLESAARRGRYEALAEIASAVNTDGVAVAHHADDQLETMLMRLIRGASAAGLSGMSPRRRLAGCGAALIRPMLTLNHAEAVAFLVELGQPWREDHTNADISRWRARLRAEVLPVLRGLRPSAAEKAGVCADRLRDVAGLVRRLTRSAIRRHVRITEHGATLHRDAAMRLDPELLRSVVRETCLRVGTPADALAAQTVIRIADAARDGSGEVRRFDLAAGVRVSVGGETVEWRRYHQGP